MTELVTFGETPLRFSPPGSERFEMATEATIYADGLESNVAVAAHELGSDATWLSKLPNNPLGRNVARQLDQQGIETRVSWADGGTGRQGLKFRESASEPRESKTWYDQGNTAIATATPGEFPMDTVQNADAFFVGVSTMLLSEDVANTTQALLRASSGAGAITAADLDYKAGFDEPDRYRAVLETISGHLDVLVANEQAARTALDRSGGARELANVIATDYDLEWVVITRSERGAVAMHNTPGTNIIHERDAIETDTAADPTGQHGAFVGGFIRELVDDADTARALSVAVATAALARTVPGPFLTLTEDEVEPVVDRVIEQSQ